MWMVQIAERVDFEKEWINAKSSDELRDIILESWRKRRTELPVIEDIEKGGQLTNKKEDELNQGDVNEEK
jgi:hypothetical protein